MTVSRRSFLGGALALVAVTALPADAFVQAPLIVGDGVHDDTAGLQALLDGRPFRVAGGSGAMLLSDEGSAVINGGNFAISDTLRVTRDNLSIANARIRNTKPNSAILYFGNTSNACITGCHFTVSGYR